MGNKPVYRTLWKKVGLAVLPGVWLVLQYQFIPATATAVDVGILVFVIAILIMFGIIIASLVIEHQLAAWCLPAFGGLLWVIDDVLEWLNHAFWHAEELLAMLDRLFKPLESMLFEGSPIWISLFAGVGAIGVLVIGCAIVYWFYRQSKASMSWLNWGVIGILFMSFIAENCIPSRFMSSCNPVAMLPSVLFFDLSPLLLLLALGLTFAKRNGFTAILFVMACVPFLIQFYLLPIGPVNALLASDHSYPKCWLEFILRLFTHLPFLCFLVIIPIGVLRAGSVKAQRIWVLAPSLVTLILVSVIRGAVLVGTELEYTLTECVRYGLITIQLSLFLFLTALLFDKVRGDNKADKQLHASTY